MWVIADMTQDPDEGDTQGKGVDTMNMVVTVEDEVVSLQIRPKHCSLLFTYCLIIFSHSLNGN